MALILLAAALLPALAPAVGLGTGDGAVDKGGEWDDDTEVWVERPDGTREPVEVHPQIKYYAEANSVTIDEARRRLGIQDAVQTFRGELRDELGDSYAGVWIEHEPEHRVLAAALPADAARVAARLEATSFSEIAGVVEVGASLADLDDLAAKVREASPVPIDTGVTVSQNAVKVQVAGDAHRRRLDDALTAAGLANRPDVVVKTVSSLARPLADVRGGWAAIVGKNACTTGFSVIRGTDGVLGVLTAAHCGAHGAAADDARINSLVTPSPTFLDAPFQEGRQDGRWDVQWHTVPGHNITNEIEYVTGGSTHREKITGVKGSGDIGEGDEVCKWGITSGYTCGKIIDRKVCPEYVKDCERTFIQVRGEMGRDMSLEGDSGGPVFSGNDAVGVLSGGYPLENLEYGGDMFYMPVEYISVFGLSVLTSPLPPIDEDRLPPRRAGADRYSTSVEISKAPFAPGLSVVYAATGANFPDALAAAAASGGAGPILLVKKDAIPTAAIAELGRLKPKRVIVLGGEAVVSQAVLSALKGRASGDATRQAGADRYSTAAAVSAGHFGPGAPVAFVATGEDFPDALAGGPAAATLGGPVLLTAKDKLPAATVAELRRLRPKRIVVLGGEAAVSPSVQAALAGYTSGETTRLSGPDRYSTAAAVSRHVFEPGAPVAHIATGQDFPDALAGGVAAALTNGPVLLVAKDSIPSATVTELRRLRPKRIVVLGGAAVVSETVRRSLAAYAAAPTDPDPGLRDGDGWRLLADESVGPPGWIGLATEPGRLEELWTKHGLKTPVPEVDFQENVVIWFGAVVGSSCPDITLEDVVVDGAVVYAKTASPTPEDGRCTADAVPHAFVVALERSRLPAGPFAIQIGAELSESAKPTQRLMVDVDLSGPGAVAGLGAVDFDDSLSQAIRSGAENIKPGETWTYRFNTRCGIEWLGEVNGVAWRTNRLMPESWESAVEAYGALEVKVTLRTGTEQWIEAELGGETVSYHRPSAADAPTCRRP